MNRKAKSKASKNRLTLILGAVIFAGLYCPWLLLVPVALVLAVLAYRNRWLLLVPFALVADGIWITARAVYRLVTANRPVKATESHADGPELDALSLVWGWPPKAAVDLVRATADHVTATPEFDPLVFA